MIAWIWAVARSLDQVIAQMPLSNVRGGVSGGLERLGDGEFVAPQPHLVLRCDPTVDTRSQGEAPGQCRGARRGANARGRVEIGEAHSSGRESVEDGGAGFGAAIAPEISRSQVIGKYEYHVGARGFFGSNGTRERC